MPKPSKTPPDIAGNAPTESTEASPERAGTALGEDADKQENPSIGDVLADPDTNGERRG